MDVDTRLGYRIAAKLHEVVMNESDLENLDGWDVADWFEAIKSELPPTDEWAHRVKCVCGKLIVGIEEDGVNHFPTVAFGAVHRLDGPCHFDDRSDDNETDA